MTMMMMNIREVAMMIMMMTMKTREVAMMMRRMMADLAGLMPQFLAYR